MAAPLDHVFLVFALDAFGGGGAVRRAQLPREPSAVSKKKHATARTARRRERHVGDKRRRRRRTKSFWFWSRSRRVRLEFLVDDDARFSQRNSDEALRSASRERMTNRHAKRFAFRKISCRFRGTSRRSIRRRRAQSAATKRGSPRHFTAAFGSVASEVAATLGAGGGGLEAARLLVVENVRPGAFAGFGDADRKRGVPRADDAARARVVLPRKRNRATPPGRRARRSGTRTRASNIG